MPLLHDCWSLFQELANCPALMRWCETSKRKRLKSRSDISKDRDTPCRLTGLISWTRSLSSMVLNRIFGNTFSPTQSSGTSSTSVLVYPTSIVLLALIPGLVPEMPLWMLKSELTPLSELASAKPAKPQVRQSPSPSTQNFSLYWVRSCLYTVPIWKIISERGIGTISLVRY